MLCSWCLPPPTGARKSLQRHPRRWDAWEGGPQLNRSDFRIFDVTPPTLITIHEFPGF